MQQLCKAVMGLHPSAPYCQASWRDVLPVHPKFWLELAVLVRDNYIQKSWCCE